MAAVAMLTILLYVVRNLIFAFLLQEDDPEKQRRWELKEQKRQQKRKTPKMKQLKVKAL